MEGAMAKTMLRDLVHNYFVGVTSNDVGALQSALSDGGLYTFCESKELTDDEKRRGAESMTVNAMNKREMVARAAQQAQIDNASNRFVATQPDILDVNVNGHVVTVRAAHERYDLAANAANDVTYFSHLVELEFNAAKNRICRVNHMMLKTDQRLEIV